MSWSGNPKDIDMPQLLEGSFDYLLKEKGPPPKRISGDNNYYLGMHGAKRMDVVLVMDSHKSPLIFLIRILCAYCSCKGILN